MSQYKFNFKRYADTQLRNILVQEFQRTVQYEGDVKSKPVIERVLNKCLGFCVLQAETLVNMGYDVTREKIAHYLRSEMQKLVKVDSLPVSYNGDKFI